MLFRPEAFEPLTDEPWSESRVRERLQAIVDAADEAFDPQTLWPADDRDLWDATKPPLKSLFVGAAGVVHALDALRQRADLDVRTDLVRAIERTLELATVESDVAALERTPEPRESSLFLGETGILLTAWSLAPSPTIADRLLVRVRENQSNDVDELMWGIPGTLLAARTMYGWTNDEHWRDAWGAAAQELAARTDADGLWTQHLGRPTRYLGPIHGAVGNAFVLLDGYGTDEVATFVETLADAAVFEDGAANWPPTAEGDLVGRDGQIRLQWCHGAPGIIASAIRYLPLQLVLAGAETTWRAGAHGPDKGPGLCHGTAGNGYALLKTFERTGDELWLERARRFAVHALAQIERTGPQRHSLFSGAFGVALFVADCLDARARFPVLETWA
jgi:Lanthionine synthetase C-like protein